MIKISVEVHEGTTPFRVAVQAKSIDQAVGIAKERYPDQEVRVVFPIDSEAFFIEGTKIGADDANQPLHGPLTQVR
ncbi:MAG TPA: hypothetical protein VFI90_17070 [Rubrobacter sp.]|nr:hypothetical protein [Rubrobacter sp.]